jgi:hypothetical protein
MPGNRADRSCESRRFCSRLIQPRRWRWLAGLAAFLALTPVLWAQRSPSIGYVYPAGARQGATCEVTLSGQYLDGLTNAFISGQGVRSSVVAYIKPLSGKPLILLRDRLKNMQTGLAAAKKEDAMIAVRSEVNTNEILQLSRTAVERETAEIKLKLANPKNQRPPNPQLAEDVTLRIVVAPDAEPGDRELRLLTAAGLSNPMLFRVGQLPEFSKKPEISSGNPRVVPPPVAGKAAPTSAPPELRILLPAVINGQIMPGAVDRHRFTARQGQHLVIAASARELVPYIADAVPGWFQATLALHDAKGKELAYDDDFSFHPDPVLYYEIRHDGEYTIEIKDAIYRGREDFVYRLTVGELPFVTSIFPLGGRAGAATKVEVKGWNLPVEAVTMDATDKEPGTYPLCARKGEWVSNFVPFAVDTLPECLEQEPNDTPGQAQKITLPIVVNGRISAPDDTDVFRFEGQAGDQVVAEVLARRLNSPLDSVLELADAAGRRVAFNDDFEDKGAGLTTHQADSRLQATLPATGAYYLRVSDAQGHGGPEYGYRLRVAPPQPDFELRVVPSSVNVRAGGTVPLMVHALRKDGFTNDITLVLKDAPAGFVLSSSRVPGHTNQARLALTAPAVPGRQPVALSLEGRALVGGRMVTHRAVPADERMQAFAYKHLVPAREMEVVVLPPVRAATPPAKAPPKQAPKTPPPTKSK